MATQVQLRRGTATENNSFTGAQGELTFDTTNKRVRIHDGATAGGFELKTENSSGDTLFADNEKAIFGAGSDLQIYHSGSHSVIKDAGDGNLQLIANDFQLRNGADNANMMTGANGGAVTLMHNGSSKLATTSTGADITGTLTSDGLTVDATTSTAVQANADAGYSLFNGATNSSGARINISGGSAANGIAINGYNAAQNGYTPLNYLAADHRFKIGSSEKMRLDTSGNILVGKTASDSDVVGVEAAQDGHVYVTVNNTLPLYINRQSGAELLRFASNGTTVGSIGTINGDAYIITGNTGLRFYDAGNSVFPVNTNGASRDNAVDLGFSTVRYKDLYLSGGVYLGGTGAANHLDDYEEGTWTPTLGGNTTYSIQSGSYVKVGRIVFAQGVISVNTLGTGSTGTISGLPFAASNSGGGNMGGGIFYFAGLAVNVISPQTYLGNNLTTLLIKSRTAAGTDLNASLAVFGNSARVDFSVTYETAS